MSAHNTKTTAFEEAGLEVRDRIYKRNEMENWLQELDRLARSSRDFSTSSADLQMTTPNDPNRIEIARFGEFGINRLAHQQLSAKLGIPKQYYDRMAKEQPDLLRENVNTWLQKNGNKLVVRTQDDNVRAVLSDRYRMLDNYDLMKHAIFPAIKEHGQELDLVIQEAALTEEHFYLKVVTPKIQTEVRKGDIVQAGFVVSNSEVGCGSWKVEQFIWQCNCSNGWVSGLSMRKYHVGRGGDEDDSNAEIFRDHTKRKINEATIAKTHDIISACLKEEILHKSAADMLKLDAMKVKRNPEEAIELTGQSLFSGGFQRSEAKSIMHELMDSGDMSAYGIACAVTRVAQDVPKYDRRMELERGGYKLIETPAEQWTRILTPDKN